MRRTTNLLPEQPTDSHREKLLADRTRGSVSGLSSVKAVTGDRVLPTGHASGHIHRPQRDCSNRNPKIFARGRIANGVCVLAASPEKNEWFPGGAFQSN